MATSTLMIGISGVRGIVGESLTPQLLIHLGEAFGTYLDSGRVVVGRDTRVSGEMVKHSVFAGLLATGCPIVDVGVCPTPSLTLMIEEIGAAGGIMISASHNPIQWNALKFFRADGGYLTDLEARQLLDLYYQGEFRKARWHEIQDVSTDARAVEVHARRVLSVVDVEKIRKRAFRVALDCCNGAGSEVTLRVLNELGCRIESIHCEMDGLFPHDPEPTFLNLGDLCRLVEKGDVDVGFAQDPDADRVAIVDETGRFIGEEYSLALAARHLLAKRAGTVVANVSTSRAVDDVARAAGCRVERVPVGEVNVAERMRELDSPVGGEGNGGVIDPRVHYGRDSLAGIALTLEFMAETGKSLSDLVNAIPRYHMVKTKVDCDRPRAQEILRRVREEYADAEINLSDGVRIDWPDAWVHLRGSNTEPVLRVIAEAAGEPRARALADEFVAKAKR